MESPVESLFLHPSILIASGVESISSKDVRFLHALRRHFANKKAKFSQPILLSEKDFELGGIMNPNDAFVIPRHAYAKMGKEWGSFPCLSKEQIYRKMYQSRLNEIFSHIINEITRDIQRQFQDWKGSKEDLFKNRIRHLYKTDIYPKIVALHLCGLGIKLGDAFHYIFQKLEGTVD